MSAIGVGIVVGGLVLLLGGFALLCVTAPARWKRRQHVERLLSDAQQQLIVGYREDGSPIWPCGPKAVSQHETGYCKRAPDHTGLHEGLITFGSGPDDRRYGTWLDYNPQPWKEEPSA